MPLSASELHRRGVEATNARRFALARRELTTAASRTDDPDLHARIDGTFAYVLAQTGEPAAAERFSRDALNRPGLRDETVIVLSGQLGTLLMHAGRLDEAEEMLTRAIEAIAENTDELANCLMNRSMARMLRHELAACTTDLERAIAIYESSGAEEPLAEARHNLGYAALLGGDLVTALTLMTRSRPTFVAIGELATAISDQDRAEVLRDAGLTTEAESLLAAVAERFGAQRMRQARGEAEYHLARSLLRHDAAAAERMAAKAARRFRALRNDGWAARAQAVRLEARVRAGLRTVAEEFTQTTSALTRSGFRTEAMALRLTARLTDEKRMPRLAADAPTPLRLRAQEVRAARAANSGRTTEAMQAAAAGLDLLSDWRRSFGALDLRASMAMHGTDLLRTGLVAAARTSDPALLFEWSERARDLSGQVAPVRPPRDAALAVDLAELRMLRADLADIDWSADARVRMLRDRVRERQWSTTSADTGAGTQRGLADARAALDETTALLSYVFTGEQLLCVTVTAHDTQVVELSWPRVLHALDGLRADLEVAALTRSGPMAAVVGHSLDARLRHLEAEIFSPVHRVTGSAQRFVLTTPGVLAGIPWAMLPGMFGVPFTLATSASRWIDDHREVRHRRVGFVAGPRVPRGRDEVARGAAPWTEATILSGDDARVAAVVDLAADTDLLHIAAHGRHAVDNPLFSGFGLADGTLFGYDVDLVPQVPHTVLLSACELGRSSVHWGEEALGMTRVWLHAGSRCVIAAPVVVADDIACELLSAAHEELSNGSAPAVALAAASVTTGLRAPFQSHGSGF